jgi:hypothetical protein
MERLALFFCALRTRKRRAKPQADEGGARDEAARPREEAPACEARLERGAHEAVATGAALGAKTGTATGLARLLVEFADANLFLDAAALDQLPEPSDGFLRRLFVTQSQLNHEAIAFRPWSESLPQKNLSRIELDEL